MSQFLATASLSFLITAGLLGQTSGYLGVGVIGVDQETADELGLDSTRGVEIAKLAPNSPAEQGGLAECDVITSYNGQPVENVEQFARLVGQTAAGEAVKIEAVSKEGRNKNATVRIGSRAGTLFAAKSRESAMERRVSIDIPRNVTVTRNLSLGATLEEISGQFAQSFGVAQGVLVRSVEDETPASAGGLRAGDVIVKVGGQPVRNPIDVRRRIAQADSDNVPFDVVRKGAKRSLTVAGGRGVVSKEALRTRAVAR